MISSKTGVKNKPSFFDQLNQASKTFGAETGNIRSTNSVKVGDRSLGNKAKNESKEARIERAVIGLVGIFNHNKIPEFKPVDNKNVLVLKTEKTQQAQQQTEYIEKMAKIQAEFILGFMSRVKELNLPQYSAYNKEVIVKCLETYNIEKFMTKDELSECFILLDDVQSCINNNSIDNLTRMTKAKFSIAQQLLVHSLYLGSDFLIQNNYKLISNIERQIGSRKIKKCIRFKISDFIGHSYGNGKYIPPHTHLGVVSMEDEDETEGHFYLE